MLGRLVQRMYHCSCILMSHASLPDARASTALVHAQVGREHCSTLLWSAEMLSSGGRQSTKIFICIGFQYTLDQTSSLRLVKSVTGIGTRLGIIKVC